MDLDSIVVNNLNVLSTLDEKDNLILYENSLNINNETDFQDLNNNEIKHTIISTLLYCLYHDCSLNVKDSLLNKIDLSVSNIYENAHLNEDLEKDKFFSNYLKSIDYMYIIEYQRYQKNKCNRFFYSLNDSFSNFCNQSIVFCRRIIEVQSMINGISFNQSEDESDGEIIDEPFDKKED